MLFTNSGTEAVEAAIKVGRTATKRSGVLSVEGGFHGLTLGALSAAGDPAFSARFQPLLPGFERVPFNDLEALEERLRREDVALFLVEPVQGKGVNLPAAGYLEGAQRLCRRYGTRNDRWIAIPFGVIGNAMVYRESQLHAAGFETLPNDTAGFLRLCRALKAKGTPAGFTFGRAIGDGSNWCHWLLWSHGARAVDASNNVVINSPETIAALAAFTHSPSAAS